MHILFATAEFRPLVSAGGLGEAAAGLVAGLRRAGHDVEVALPDYHRLPLLDEKRDELTVPSWAGPAVVRRGRHAEAGMVSLINVPGIERPNPYVDEQGEGWADNDRRFAAFSAAVAALAEGADYDVVQLNDWHTGLVPAFLGSPIPTVLTIHNLAHQGWANIGWLHELPCRRDAYGRDGALNMLAGAIQTVDAVVAVSPTYASEIVNPEGGMGLHEILAARGDGLVGIRNGIDARSWDPAHDEHLPAAYSADDLQGKDKARRLLREHAGWDDDRKPLIAMVTRLVEQKGIDLAFEASRFLPGMKARLMILGSGDRHLGQWGRRLADEDPAHIWFQDDYDVPLSHLMFAGADLLLMPSRFEPCGLAQMQAMAYGTIPIVTDVGGLADTVVDADGANRASSTGFVSASAETVGVVDAMHRAVNGWRSAARRKAMMRRGMKTDWSWDGPTEEFVALYQRVIDG